MFKPKHIDNVINVLIGVVVVLIVVGVGLSSNIVYKMF